MGDQEADLLLRGGLVQTAGSSPVRADVAFSDGLVLSVGHAILPDAAEQVLDVSGLLVLPGFVDLHAHVFHGAFRSCLHADAVCPRTGVTTVVDAGSGGFANFPGLPRYVVPQTTTRLRAFVNLAALGLAPTSLGIPELRGLELAREGDTIATIREFPDIVLGVKVRLDRKAVEPDLALKALAMARRVAVATGTRVMVHVAGSPVPLPTVLDALGAGDVVTHVYHGGEHGLLDGRGRLHAAVGEARRRGVLFDVGHAGHHLDPHVVRTALTEGFVADTISTDLHQTPDGSPSITLPAVMTSLLDLGMAWDDVLAGVTVGPAAVLGEPEGLGDLAAGSPGDAVVVELADEQGGHRLTVRHTVMGGQVWEGDTPRGLGNGCGEPAPIG